MSQSSHTTVLAGAERLSKEACKVCEQTSADGVLVVRLVDSKSENGILTIKDLNIQEQASLRPTVVVWFIPMAELLMERLPINE